MQGPAQRAPRTAGPDPQLLLPGAAPPGKVPRSLPQHTEPLRARDGARVGSSCSLGHEQPQSRAGSQGCAQITCKTGSHLQLIQHPPG